MERNHVRIVQNNCKSVPLNVLYPPPDTLPQFLAYADGEICPSEGIFREDSASLYDQLQTQSAVARHLREKGFSSDDIATFLGQSEDHIREILEAS